MSALTPSSAHEAGLSRSGLYRAAQAGTVTQIARGIYLPTEDAATDWDLVEAAVRHPSATICLTSALAYHDLTDEIPAALHIAIPRGSRTPSTNATIAWHQFDRATFELEREDIPIPRTKNVIGVYSAPRSIADAFRLRGIVGYELARDALIEWLNRGGKPATLLSIATRLPRAKGPVLNALDILS